LDPLADADQKSGVGAQGVAGLFALLVIDLR
jgi:hypothetical protein